MREELARWWAAAAPAWPVAAWLAGAMLAGFAAASLMFASRIRQARVAEAWAAEQMRLADCVDEPTVEMAVLPGGRSRLRMLVDCLGQRVRAALRREPDGPDWTVEELAAVRATPATPLTEGLTWPSPPAPPVARGQLPRLRRRSTTDGVPSPRAVAARIRQIRAEQGRAA